MSLTFIADHILRALDRLPEQYRGKQRIAAFISTFIQQVQDIEDAQGQLQVGRHVTSATGVNLDGVGKIVGLARIPGQSDETYRALIQIRIVQNLNQATPEELIAAAKFFLNNENIIYTELYPAAIAIFSTSEFDAEDAAFNKAQLQRLAAAGVKIAEFGTIPSRAFRFDSGPGFSDEDGSELGGVFAAIYT